MVSFYEYEKLSVLSLLFCTLILQIFYLIYFSWKYSYIIIIIQMQVCFFSVWYWSENQVDIGQIINSRYPNESILPNTAVWVCMQTGLMFICNLLYLEILGLSMVPMKYYYWFSGGSYLDNQGSNSPLSQTKP